MALSLSERVLKLTPSATVMMAGRARALIEKGIDVVNLTTGEPDFETPATIIEAAKKALDKGVNKYTDIRGTKELLTAICTKFKRDQGLQYEATQVMSTVGGKAALSSAIDAIIGPGDEAIIFSPYWVSYPELVMLAEGTPVFVDCDANFKPSLEDFKQKITDKTKLVILNSPNNPSGVVYDEAFLRGVMKALEGTQIWVISDEIYEHLVFDGVKHISPASLSSDAFLRTLVISGASKAYAMTGWRVGIAGGPTELITAMTKLQSQRYTCIAGVAQAAASYAFLEPSEIQESIATMRSAYQERRDAVLKMVSRVPGLKCNHPEGAFYAMIDFSNWIGKSHLGSVIKDDLDLASRLLDEAHVAVVAGTPFGAPNTVRISLASSLDRLTEGMKRINQFLQS